ncbi:MAG TPA: hypothetical protein VLK79_14505 [Gaiellales bacterium]|nr:hypothetical protein [Gaiellales bacterium]
MSGDKRELFDRFGRLRVVGYWLPSADPVAVDVHEAIDPTWDETERALVVGYLIHAPAFRAFMGVSPCRLCDCRVNGSAELTDGTYRWPEGFAHYLVHHRVRPPDHFVEHALANAHLVEAWNAEPGHRAITVRDPAYPRRFRWKRLSSGIFLRSGNRR